MRDRVHFFLVPTSFIVQVLTFPRSQVSRSEFKIKGLLPLYYMGSTGSEVRTQAPEFQVPYICYLTELLVLVHSVI